MDPLTYIFTLLPARVAVPVLSTIGLCAVLDAVLPQPRAGSVWVVPRRVVTVIGANWAYARNLLSPATPLRAEEASPAALSALHDLTDPAIRPTH